MTINNESEKLNWPMGIITKIFLKKFPDNASTISPEIPDNMMPTPIEISQLLIVEITCCGNPRNEPSTATPTIIQIMTLNFSIYTRTNKLFAFI